MKPGKILSTRIKELREQAGLSQQELANRADLSVSQVAKLEQGAKADPRASTLLALAFALDVKPGRLLDDLPFPSPLKKKEEKAKRKEKKAQKDKSRKDKTKKSRVSESKPAKRKTSAGKVASKPVSKGSVVKKVKGRKGKKPSPDLLAVRPSENGTHSE